MCYIDKGIYSDVSVEITKDTEVKGQNIIILQNLMNVVETGKRFVRSDSCTFRCEFRYDIARMNTVK